jgi:hypothetical protein
MDELEDIMVNKISQSQEDKYGMFCSCVESRGKGMRVEGYFREEKGDQGQGKR